MGKDLTKLFTCQQWTCLAKLPDEVELQLDKVPAVESYFLVNLGDAPAAGGEQPKLYYQAENGKYGEPLIRPEPSYGLTIPKNLAIRKKDPVLGWDDGEVFHPVQKLTGIICKDETGKVVARASLSKLVKAGDAFGFQPNGSFLLNGENWWLKTLLDKDKNRIVGGLDGFFRKEKPAYIAYAELEDLDL
jgi:hypothetical protein